MLQSKWEKYKYDDYLKNQTITSQKKEKIEEEKPPSSKKLLIFNSHRNRENVPSLGKWNLSSFFTADPSNSFFLEELTRNLLTELYGHTEFWKEAIKQTPKLSQALVHSFLENIEGATNFSDLFPSESKLQKPFYKMLKGSGSYNLLKKEGYPPLDHFFSLNKKSKSITNFSQAPLPLLNALFQSTTVEAILALEKNKWEKDQYIHSLTKEELKSLCIERGLSIPGKRFQDIEPFLQFSHKKAKLEKLTYKDAKTHVNLELIIPKQTD